MKSRLLVAGAACAVLMLSAPIAFADYDDYGDTNGCAKSAARGGWDDEARNTDVVQPLAEGYELWAPGGHYVVRNDEGNFVEVIGGSGYNRGDGNQGGYVQGEYHVDDNTSVDFHANTFAGGAAPNHSEFACVGGEAGGQDTSVTTPGGNQPDQCDTNPNTNDCPKPRL